MRTENLYREYYMKSNCALESREVMKKIKNIANTRFGSKILTQILLYKNLSEHKKLMQTRESKQHANGCESPYQYMKILLQNHPEIMDKLAIMQDRNITYRELWNEVGFFANYLRHAYRDYHKGEIFSVCAASSIEGVVAFFALNRLGIASGRIFNGSQANKMEYNLNNFASRIVLIDNANLGVLSKVVKQTKVKTVILLSECEENLKHRFAWEHPEIELIQYVDVMNKGKAYNDSFEEKVFSEDLASILYTSGSSGEPKPISIQNKTYVNMVNVVSSTTNIAKCDGERVIGVVSQEYPYANINCTAMILMMGKTLIMPVHRADKTVDFDKLLDTRPNRIQAIPNFYKLWEETDQVNALQAKSYSFLNSVISGGEQYLTSEKIELLSFLAKHDSRPLLIDGFGFGELGSATALKFGLNEYFLLMNGIEAKAVHPETKEKLSVDEEGILCFTGPTIAKGYYNNPEQTQKCFVKDEKGKMWFVSDTYGLVHGRKRRLIKVGGRIREYFITDDGFGNFVKVYAGTVEDVIMSCDCIQDCIIVPSDAGATPRPIGYIVVSKTVDLSKQQVIESVENRCKSLEKFAQPIRYEIEEKIVRTEAGKKDYEYYRGKNREIR